MVAVICYFTDPEIVIMALVATVGIVAALTLYAMQTKNDFSIIGSVMY